MTDPEPVHPLTEKQRLMGVLRAAYRGNKDEVPTKLAYRLADIFTKEISHLEEQLAQTQSALRHANARVQFYVTQLEGQPRLDRQIEQATPPKHATEEVTPDD